MLRSSVSQALSTLGLKCLPQKQNISCGSTCGRSSLSSEFLCFFASGNSYKCKPLARGSSTRPCILSSFSQKVLADWNLFLNLQDRLIFMEEPDSERAISTWTTIQQGSWSCSDFFNQGLVYTAPRNLRLWVFFEGDEAIASGIMAKHHAKIKPDSKNTASTPNAASNLLNWM